MPYLLLTAICLIMATETPLFTFFTNDCMQITFNRVSAATYPPAFKPSVCCKEQRETYYALPLQFRARNTNVPTHLEIQ